MDNALLFPALILLASFVWMLVINTPIAVAITLATGLTLLSIGTTIPLPADALIAHRMVGGMESFTLLAIPMFILAGSLMGRGGIARRLMDFASLLLHRLPGGLALANVLACMMFGSISGSAAAAVSSIGGCMIPEMKRAKYPDTFSVAVTATAATTGLLIPPSNVIIVYAMLAGSLSVRDLFLAGILPGVTMGLILMLFAMVICAWRGYGRLTVAEMVVQPVVTWRGAMLCALNAMPCLLLGVGVLWGIIAGVFTATEAAAISVLVAFIFAVLIYREVKWHDLKDIFLESGITSAIVLMLIGSSCAMSWVLSYVDIPQNISAMLLNLTSNKWILLLVINFILLFVGTFMDMTPAILIFTPILLPVMIRLGVDPLHFGIFMIANLCVGLCTPPVGTCLFVGCSVGKTRLMPTTRAMIPFFLAMVLSVGLIVACPWLSTFLPHVLTVS